jgi:hypothetical protein
MGWFWADSSPAAPVAPHHMPANASAAPPVCTLILDSSSPTNNSTARMSHARTCRRRSHSTTTLHHHKAHRLGLSMPLRTTNRSSERTLRRLALLHFQTKPTQLHAQIPLQPTRPRRTKHRPPSIPRTLHHPPRRRPRQLGIPFATANVQRHVAKGIHGYTKRERKMQVFLLK